MDYTDDACMYMFSQGQIDVVDAYVSGVLEAQFKPNTVPVCVDTPEYTMTDGLINACNGIFYDSGGADVVMQIMKHLRTLFVPKTQGKSFNWILLALVHKQVWISLVFTMRIMQMTLQHS